MAGRRKPVSAFAVGLTLIIIAVIVSYLAFTKDVPFINPPYQIKAAFRDTSGITPNSPVRIAGVDVGKVTGIDHVSPGSSAAVVTMAIDDKGRPVHNDATAKIRPRIFLEGNFFVELSPGTPSAPEIHEGATIPTTRTANPVQFDQVLGALRADTRQDLRDALSGVAATQDAGGAKAFSDSLQYQPPAYKFTAIVSQALLGKAPGDLGDFVRDGGSVAGALTADRGKLRSLIVDFNTTAAALADRQAALRASVNELPNTLSAALPAFAALDAAFPDVSRFAVAARPGVRSTGPTVDAALPLVKQLRGLVKPSELLGVSRDLRAATPGLAKVSKLSVPVLTQLRAAASCTTNVLVPFGNDKIQDPVFPASGPVYEELVKFLPGLAGESRTNDANGQMFKVLGTGGAETLDLGNGLFGTVLEPIVGVNPPPVRTRPPLRPNVPCETQQPPDLHSNPVGGPRVVNTSSAASTTRSAKAQKVAVDLMRVQLKAQGQNTQVLDRAATLDDIKRIAASNGLTAQLNKVLRAGK